MLPRRGIEKVGDVLDSRECSESEKFNVQFPVNGALDLSEDDISITQPWATAPCELSICENSMERKVDGRNARSGI